jgi:UDP-glucose 4-epimerase
VVDIFYKKLQINKPVLFSGEEREGDPKNWKSDISILSGLGYKNEINIENGIEDYAQWVKELS